MPASYVDTSRGQFVLLDGRMDEMTDGRTDRAVCIVADYLYTRIPIGEKKRER